MPRGGGDGPGGTGKPETGSRGHPRGSGVNKATEPAYPRTGAAEAHRDKSAPLKTTRTIFLKSDLLLEAPRFFFFFFFFLEPQRDRKK